MSNNNDEKVRTNFILSYRDYYGRYHDHKEKMAWIATSLYLGGIWFIYSANALCAAQKPRIMFISFIFICLFVWWQFRQRKFASEIVFSITNDKLSIKYIPDDLITKIIKRRSWIDEPEYSEFLSYIVIIIWTYIFIEEKFWASLLVVLIILLLFIRLLVYLMEPANVDRE
ncbi:MAG: hypothetical protein WBV23_09035 [Desulfobaccales bacterium]